MAYSVPATATSGGVATAAMWNAGVRDNMAAVSDWTSYTPVVTQSGAVTKTVTYAKYRKFGTTCKVIAALNLTGAGTITNVITVSLPSGATSATSTALEIGEGSVQDTGTATYPFHVKIASTTTVKFMRIDNAPTDFVGIDPNFALANGDFITFNCEYETT